MMYPVVKQTGCARCSGFYGYMRNRSFWVYTVPHCGLQNYDTVRPAAWLWRFGENIYIPSS